MTSQLAIVNGTVILEDELLEGAHVLCEDDRIMEVARGKRVPKAAKVVDARGGFISPGFVDIHVHGGNGADFMDGTVAAVQTACLAHAKHGTTTIFPTTTTSSIVGLDHMVRQMKKATSASLPEVVRMASLTPAERTGLAGETGSIAVGFNFWPWEVVVDNIF